MEHVGIKNYVIGVMDDETQRYLIEKGNTNWFRVKLPVPSIQEHSHPANRVSAECPETCFSWCFFLFHLFFLSAFHKLVLLAATLLQAAARQGCSTVHCAII